MEEFEGKLYKDKQGRWVYDKEFLDWLVKISPNYNSQTQLINDIGLTRCLIETIKKNNDIKMNFKRNKNSPDYKAIYQDYDWCYQHYVVQGETLDEMAMAANASKRVIEKWCRERFKLDGYLRRNVVKLSQIQKELIMASMLGDGHIDRRETQPMFIVNHAENQKDYLYWKYDIVKNLCNKEPSEVLSSEKIINEKKYKYQKQYRICTRIVNALKPLRSMSKYEIVNQLNEFQLSVYMLDDGYRGSSWSICVAMLDEKTKDLFMNVCKEKFNLKCHICECDNRYIYFDANSSRALDKIILANIPNELDIIQYKIINNNKITKGDPYVYVICGNKQIGVSTYYRINHHSSKADSMRKYLLEHNIFFIQEEELKLLEKRWVKYDK